MIEKNNNGYKLTTESRLSKLEAYLEEIKDNHLPHLQSRVDKIMWLLIATLAGVAVDLLLRIIM